MTCWPRAPASCNMVNPERSARIDRQKLFPCREPSINPLLRKRAFRHLDPCLHNETLREVLVQTHSRHLPRTSVLHPCARRCNPPPRPAARRITVAGPKRESGSRPGNSARLPSKRSFVLPRLSVATRRPQTPRTVMIISFYNNSPP